MEKVVACISVSSASIKGTDESVFGAMLFTTLDGTALRAFDAVNMDELEQTGGQDLVYQVLDDRFPEEAIHDRIGEVLDKVFDLKVETKVNPPQDTLERLVQLSKQQRRKVSSCRPWPEAICCSEMPDCRRTRKQL